MTAAPHEQLRDARIARGLTQSQLAERVEENVHWVSKRETGETRLAVADVERLAAAMELSNYELLRLLGREPEGAA